MYDDNVEGSIAHIETFMTAFDLEEEEVGIVLSPRYDEDKGSMAMDYFVKGGEDDQKPALDAAVYSEMSGLEFNSRVYGEWKEAIEQRFDQAEVLATDPEELAPESQEWSREL